MDWTANAVNIEQGIRFREETIERRDGELDPFIGIPKLSL